MNRETRSGRCLGPEERVDARTALEAVTVNAAFQYFEERQKGTLAPGKQADLVVLDRDPVVTDPAAICSIRVLRTVKGGETVWQRT